jgi:hypothetical protein
MVMHRQSAHAAPTPPGDVDRWLAHGAFAFEAKFARAFGIGRARAGERGGRAGGVFTAAEVAAGKAAISNLLGGIGWATAHCTAPCNVHRATCAEAIGRGRGLRMQCRSDAEALARRLCANRTASIPLRGRPHSHEITAISNRMACAAAARGGARPQ